MYAFLSFEYRRAENVLKHYRKVLTPLKPCYKESGKNFEIFEKQNKTIPLPKKKKY